MGKVLPASRSGMGCRASLCAVSETEPKAYGRFLPAETPDQKPNKHPKNAFELTVFCHNCTQMQTPPFCYRVFGLPHRCLQDICHYRLFDLRSSESSQMSVAALLKVLMRRVYYSPYVRTQSEKRRRVVATANHLYLCVEHLLKRMLLQECGGP